MDTCACHARMEAELLEVMKALRDHLHIHTMIMLASTPLSLGEMVGGIEREHLLRETLATIARRREGERA